MSLHDDQALLHNEAFSTNRHTVNRLYERLDAIVSAYSQFSFNLPRDHYAWIFSSGVLIFPLLLFVLVYLLFLRHEYKVIQS